MSTKLTLIPVTIGNIIGGVVFAAPVYRVVFLRNKRFPGS